MIHPLTHPDLAARVGLLLNTWGFYSHTQQNLRGYCVKSAKAPPTSSGTSGILIQDRASGICGGCSLINLLANTFDIIHRVV